MSLAKSEDNHQTNENMTTVHRLHYFSSKIMLVQLLYQIVYYLLCKQFQDKYYWIISLNDNFKRRITIILFLSVAEIPSLFPYQWTKELHGLTQEHWTRRTNKLVQKVLSSVILRYFKTLWVESTFPTLTTGRLSSIRFCPMKHGLCKPFIE